MAPLNPTVALTALTDVDVELAVNGLARDLDLELLGDVSFAEGAAAVGAAVRQRRLMDLVDFPGGWRLAVGLGAIVIARLTAGLARGRFGPALGEGSGLALAGARRFVELVAEALVLGLQVANPSLEGLAVGTPDPLYATSLFLCVGMPLALGSFSALVPAATVALVLVVRTALEDRMLQNELPGYREYASRVRFRLLPRIW
jgi:hypothetical protein